MRSYRGPLGSSGVIIYFFGEFIIYFFASQFITPHVRLLLFQQFQRYSFPYSISHSLFLFIPPQSPDRPNSIGPYDSFQTNFRCIYKYNANCRLSIFTRIEYWAHHRLQPIRYYCRPYLIYISVGSVIGMQLPPPDHHHHTSGHVFRRLVLLYLLHVFLVFYRPLGHL